MEVYAVKFLDRLIEPTREIAEIATMERRKLGMPYTENFDVYVTFFEDDNSTSSRLKDNGEFAIYINTFPMLKEMRKSINDKNFRLDYAIETIDDLYKYAKRRFNDAADEQIFSIFEGVKEFSEYKLYYEPFLNRHIHFKPDIMYNMTCEEIVQYSARCILFPEWKDIILDAINEMYTDITPYILRYEIDYDDFYSNAYIMQKAIESKHKIMNGPENVDPKSIQEYLDSYNKHITSLWETHSLLFGRPSFFECVKPNEWGNIDIEKTKEYVKNKIKDKLFIGHMDYLINFIGQFYELKKHCEKNCYDDMFDFFRYEFGKKMDLGKYMKYKENIAKHLNDAELFIQTAVDAIGTAFKEDPSRFKFANEAESFEKYIDICKGK